MIRSIPLPIQLLSMVAAIGLFGSYIDKETVRFFYTISVFFKEVLFCVLPFIIVAFVVTGIVSFKKNAPAVLALLASIVTLSNAAVALVAYGIGAAVLPLLSYEGVRGTIVPLVSITPWYIISLPVLLSAEKALIVSLIVGFTLSFLAIDSVQRPFFLLRRLVEYFLHYFFIPLLPLYAAGFLLKVYYEGALPTLFAYYGLVCLLIIGLQYCYLLCMYLVAADCSFLTMGVLIKNVLPSYITAFSTMSSTATIPVSIAAAEKNIDNKPLVHVGIPIMANIHMIGDSIGIPLLALMTLLLFQGAVPSLSEYMVFIGYFCMAMFAASGIPGGAIIAVSQLLITRLGFNSEMIDIMMMLHFSLDSFGTAANVTGDGALIVMVNKLLKKFRIGA